MVKNKMIQGRIKLPIDIDDPADFDKEDESYVRLIDFSKDSRIVELSTNSAQNVDDFTQRQD